MLDIPNFWKSMAGRFHLLPEVALQAIWILVLSVDIERSFSQHKHLLNDRERA